ncbi:MULTISPECIES: lactate dehydrogenase [unclassified Sedimentibacter]|uniref:lactate dehydrogenase n=1 Tax=unclassified Sedimentibacter TaxID=2649220 RepID=UPI0027E114A2|nr:lactate dehydrogenase [Sedimentibacter sp. MB35-C1]WMJ75711.1 lactate dehydrogenase [Sedimentibacter sp. MB35-C1]
MFYYKYKNTYLFSLEDNYNFEKLESLPDNLNELYFLCNIDKNKSKKSYAVSHTSDIFAMEESLEMLKLTDRCYDIDDKITRLIEQRKIKAVNTSYNDFEDCLSMECNIKKKVNILALGDVGSTLLTGLRLLGGNSIGSIGIFDRSPDKIKRWEYEMNQTSYPFDFYSFPEVQGISKEELFDCDMFVFCASKGVPPVGSEGIDVRMVQFEENKKLIKEYAVMAAKKNFTGIFAVVSDPVDPLCASVLKESEGKLAPEQIKGYGLGVMNARAAYYAKKDDKYSSYLSHGRAFGPHGNGLVIANSIDSYDNNLSEELTKLAVQANLQVRETGFKPYIAPALSSGAISIVLTLEGKWHYSSNYLGGVFMGAKNRNIPSGLEIEKIIMPNKLFKRLEKTYNELKKFI